MPLQTLLLALGAEITDPSEESFHLFSQRLPSQNLGFVDASARLLDLSVAGIDMAIQQSPALLTSSRAGGTTGAVWKITPLFASWIASASNVFFETGVLDSRSTVLELGCGVSGVVALALGPRVRRYVATDQGYVFRLLRENVENNPPKEGQSGKRRGRKSTPQAGKSVSSNIEIVPLDWESTVVSSLPALCHPSPSSSPHESALDLILACDCIYNEALIDPFVRTCTDLCLLGQESSNLSPHATPTAQKPTLCVVAQQLRSHTIFEAWLEAFHAAFRVWRVPDGLLSEGLSGEEWFVVHVGVLRGVEGDE